MSRRHHGRPRRRLSFELRRGVCQDFAHIMISGLRGLGLPAAYVSGYLRTVPRDSPPRLEGADAMHAWMKVWCGEAGWWGLDPTNAILAARIMSFSRSAATMPTRRRSAVSCLRRADNTLKWP